MLQHALITVGCGTVSCRLELFPDSEKWAEKLFQKEFRLLKEYLFSFYEKPSVAVLQTYLYEEVR
jgi:hypothetical protein